MCLLVSSLLFSIVNDFDIISLVHMLTMQKQGYIVLLTKCGFLYTEMGSRVIPTG